jgi:uncharacterized protein YndB with AHSA1/START domain
MSRSLIAIEAPRERVFEVLLDPTAYKSWVVGADEVREVSGGWPREGSAFDHRVGAGPVKIEDDTTVEEVEPPERLVLEVHFRPVGVATVVIEAAPLDDGDSCMVALTEEPTAGWTKAVFDTPARPLIEAAFAARNAWSLRRLRRTVLRRMRAAA